MLKIDINRLLWIKNNENTTQVSSAVMFWYSGSKNGRFCGVWSRHDIRRQLASRFIDIAAGVDDAPMS